jgi:hypothetical protein
LIIKIVFSLINCVLSFYVCILLFCLCMCTVLIYVLEVCPFDTNQIIFAFWYMYMFKIVYLLFVRNITICNKSLQNFFKSIYSYLHVVFEVFVSYEICYRALLLTILHVMILMLWWNALDFTHSSPVDVICIVCVSLVVIMSPAIQFAVCNLQIYVIKKVIHTPVTSARHLNIFLGSLFLRKPIRCCVNRQYVKFLDGSMSCY